VTIGTTFGPNPELARAEHERRVDELRRRGFEELRDLRNVDARGLVADEVGRLWIRGLGEPHPSAPRHPGDWAFVVTADGAAVWFRRPEPPRPRTLDEYQAEQERVRAVQARVLAERDRAIEKLSKEAARVVAFGDVDRLAPATPVEAGGRIRRLPGSSTRAP